MTHPYVPATDQDKKAMLEAIGLDSIDDLFNDIPESFRIKDPLNLDKSKSELEVLSYLTKLAKENKTVSDYPCFLGAGAYDHYIPTIIDSLISRSEFYTSYTPYQPEISQGTLQSIFEFQTLIARLTGMDIANASLYDGGTACAEAAIMACASSRKGKILVSKTINPSSLEILETYLKSQDLELVVVDMKDGKTDLEDLKAKLDDQTAGVIIQSPNFFGLIEDVEETTKLTHTAKKAAMILSTDPFSLGLLKTPGAMGVDIVVGEGQSLGLPLAYGGPYLGILATNEKYMRKIPGRLIGETVDEDGKRAFVLTLAAREQHIKREKATSNICTNQGLMALAATIYMVTMGKEGMKEAAYQATQKAHYAFEKLTASGKFKPLFDGPFFLEFALTSDLDYETVNKALLDAGIIGGYNLGKDFPEFGNAILFAVTEKRSKEEIDKLVEVLEGIK
ncbi:MAG: aminomethyl-transferring glycine dehydrogenase subunit GcvPA [Bacillota bacterium]|nr:aminomethyl-transferring glycine dehydrogenase subunit GcvPA [Bacillota bacterium]